ncbi:spore coat protein [Paenibacillus sp. 481]|nr:spore coat protein [Paenibacillus sp. 481]UHA72328.1 spore coat protein [Paenibacillus sp. 481]
MPQGQGQGFMPEGDLLYTILADLKRTSREYTTAVTEAACPVVRQMFTDLTHSTLQLQGELFYLMEQNNMYSVSSGALQQEVTKQLQQNQQTLQKTQQFLQQKQQSAQYAQTGHSVAHQPSNYSAVPYAALTELDQHHAHLHHSHQHHEHSRHEHLHHAHSHHVQPIHVHQQQGHH